MRSLEECKIEVFRRSEERIKNRKIVILKRSLISGIGAVACVMLTLCVIKWAMTVRLSDRPAGDVGLNDYDNEMMLPDGNGGNANAGGTEDFSFRLTWGCNGNSSYDSATGELIKDKAASNRAEFTTTYKLSDEEKQEIYEMIKKLDVDKYPDSYNPHNNLMSSPSWTIILVVCENGEEKMIAANDIAIEERADNVKGQKFLDTCLGIRDILMETNEWKVLPEYEVLYD